MAALTVAPVVMLATWATKGGEDTISAVAWGMTSAAVLAVTFLYGLSCTTWGRFAVTRAVLFVTGRLPWRTLTFMTDAHRRGVLRQIGGIYQFRHAIVRERLAQDEPQRQLPSFARVKQAKKWTKKSGGDAELWAFISSIPGLLFAILFSFIIVSWLPGRPGPYLPQHVIPRFAQVPALIPAMQGWANATTTCQPPTHNDRVGYTELACHTDNTERTALDIEVVVTEPLDGHTAVWFAAETFRSKTGNEPTRDPHFRALANRDPICDWRHEQTRTQTKTLVEVTRRLRCQNLLFWVRYQAQPHTPMADAIQFSSDVLEKTSSAVTSR